MNKKLLAVAVAGALAAPIAAFAQSTVTIYGRANAGLDNWKATGSSAGAVGDYRARTRVYDSGSRVGFRGTENLGGGMEAYFVMEAGVNIDSGLGLGQSTAANVSTGSIASRDSFVGIKGGWGEVSWGRQSIFWGNGLNSQTGPNYINSAVDGMLNGTGLVAIPVSRQSNVMAYTSPRLGGMFDITASFSPTREAATAGPSVNGTTTVTSDNIYGLTGKFRSGPWYAQADWARTKLDATRGGAKNTGAKIGASYGYAPDSRVALIYERNRNNGIGAAIGTSALVGDSLRQRVWVFNVEHAMGAWRLYGLYANAGAIRGATGATGNTGTKSTGWTLGTKYMFSPRTGVYASYNKITNGSAAFADLNGGGYSSAAGGALAAANAGADLRVWGLGMMHNF